MSDVLDVVVVGGGPVGACMAALLARASGAPFRLAVLEPQRPGLPAEDSPVDLRVSAFSRAGERLLQAAGAWEAIRGRRICPYERMRVWHESVAPDSASALLFDAAEAAEANLGYIIENRLVQAALLDACEQAGVQIVPAQLRGLRFAEGAVAIDTAAGALEARLVIGADGARSAVREAAGLTAEWSDYRQSAIVATVATERPHASTAWQRFLRSGTLAFLPLADGTSSIVWSVDDELAPALLEAPAEAFAAELERAADRALGAVRLVSERSAFPLRRMQAHRYVTQRCALIGDAAHVVHPLAGQGMNLGLLDAAALAELLAAARSEGEDPGALRILRRYERWRRTEAELMSAAIDAFNRFLAHGSGPLARLAQHGLGWVNRTAELKRLFIGRALGTAGELPRLAAGRPHASRP